MFSLTEAQPTVFMIKFKKKKLQVSKYRVFQTKISRISFDSVAFGNVVATERQNNDSAIIAGESSVIIVICVTQ